MKPYKFQQLHPAKARGTFSEELWDSPFWSADEKYDGDRRIAQFCKGAVRFTGSRESKKDGLLVEKTANVPHLNLAHGQLTGTVLDGEMLAPWPGARSKDTCAVMGSKAARAIELQEKRGWLKFVVFDCLYFCGEDIRERPLYERRAAAVMALHKWGNVHTSFADVMMHEKRSFLSQIWKRGGEGVILKKNDSKYGDEKSWVKVKKELTVDVVILGFQKPRALSKKRSGETTETKWAARGLIGSFTYGMFRGAKLVELGTCSGMTDAEREAMTRHPRRYVGQVAELECQLIEPSGALRHPRFVRMRPDKNPRDCAA
jgi:ATP-dependent DNA ligase